MEHATKRPRIEAEGIPGGNVHLAPTSLGQGQIQLQPQPQQPQQIPLVVQDVAALETAIDSLPINTLKDLLLRAALHDNLVGGAVGWSIFASANALRDAEVAAERARVIDFDRYSKNAWHVLNSKYARLSGSREYEMAGDAETEVERMLETILEQTTPHSSYGTKKSAAETMRKIFKSVCLADGVIGHEIHQGCAGWDEMLADVLLDRMDNADRGQLVSEENGAWLDKFRSLVSLADDYCMFENLHGVLEELDGLFEDDSEEEDEEEDEHDSEGN
ncbi:hypothetical protein SLS62_002049 [Diatrype stigma]|uniref:Uncharacterized protein n=1 Tax=Diatrype stigma TaxID=117547 RepID=A0AAN9UYV2_9PEZI